jgi:dTMP kinase
MQKKSLFIVIEGLDGSGKTSVSKQLAQDLDAERGIVQWTYEPNNDYVAGTFIRDILTKKHTDFSPQILPLAFATNRLDHCDRLIRPWMAANNEHIVISDRYYLSSLVYQSSPDFPFEKVMQFNQFALKPDIIFFINVDTKVCYERMKIRNQPPELFETNLGQSREKYFKAIEFLKETRGENIVEVSGNGSILEIVAVLKTALLPYLT